MFDLELPAKFRRYVPLAAWLVVVLVLLAIPLKIIGYGYLPGDDALRHCAKAVSGKPWPEIIVTGDSFKLDHNLGWHGVLGFVHQATGWNAEGLLVFSVVALFALVNFAVLPWLKRPEAWLAVLLTTMVISDLPQRFLLGRPFVITITVLMTVFLLARKQAPHWKNILFLTALLAACTFIHGVWYLWLLPIAAFVFAGQFRWALALAGAWMGGTFVAMLLSGHPLEYLGHALELAVQGVGGHLTNRTEVTELQPFGGDILAVILVGALVALRAAKELGQLDRVILGTDAPAGSGVQPLGVLRMIAQLASLGEVAPEVAFCFATGNTARIRGLDCGLIEPGRACDLVIFDRAQHTAGRDVLDSVALGDLPGIGMTIIDGIVRTGRSRNTPPAERIPEVV
mgnify:CR=1 FL=1